MRKERRRLLLAVPVFAALISGVVWLALRSPRPTAPDPVYDGHPLSYWVDPSAWPKTTGSVPLPHPAAGSLDSNALPYLIDALQKRDGPVRSAYNRVWPHLPGWLENRLPTPKYASWTVRYNACRYLGDLGASARPAVPELLRLLREDVMMVKAGAAEALGRIASRDDQPVIAGLSAATKDHDLFVRERAAEAIKAINPEAAAKAGVK